MAGSYLLFSDLSINKNSCPIFAVCMTSGGVLQIQDLNVTVEGLEKERDFYFGKLRDVEVLCQEHENDDVPLVKQILDILYATEVSMTNVCFFLAGVAETESMSDYGYCSRCYCSAVCLSVCHTYVPC